MAKGAVTISIDVELAWGNWDNITNDQLQLVEQHERAIVDQLTSVFEKYDIPATFAIVAALLDPNSAQGRPGRQDCWYAPDVIEMIARSPVGHDIGSHGGRHKYFNSMLEAEADEDLDFARNVHAAHGLGFSSFVFPRNQLGNKSLLERHGVAVYRGEDRAWHQRIRSRNETAGRIANLADKMLPIAPEPVSPERDGKMINLPGSMLFMSRNGLRKFAAAGVTKRKLDRGVDAAVNERGVFHLWFHPSNFYHARDSQFALFEEFIGKLRGLIDRDLIEVKPMASFAIV